MSQKIKDWEVITPATLVVPVEHIRNTFEHSLWKCSRVTEKLCFAELHPDHESRDLEAYRSAFAQYQKIIGLSAAQQFDRDHRVGTPPAVFHAFLHVFAQGIRTEIHRVFNELLEIGIAHSAELDTPPPDWAKAHLHILIDDNKHCVTLWIKSVCDKQDSSKPQKTDQETDDFILWKDWRAPKLVYMQPSGNLPYDPSTAWTREDGPMTEELLKGLSDNVIMPLEFDVDRLAGQAHVELAKAPHRGAEDDDRRFARMAIDEARKSVPEDDRPHPKVGAVVVKDGRVLSKAHRGESPSSHAEYIALERKLPDDSVAGATVYTTLEPCTTRKHPKIPCAERLVERRVARVVIGMPDPNPDIRGLGDQFLSDAGIEIQLFPRDLRAQVEDMNHEFIRIQKARQTPARTTAEPPQEGPTQRSQSSRLRPSIHVTIVPISRGTPRGEYFLEDVDDLTVLIEVPGGGHVRVPRADFVESWDDARRQPKLELTRKYFQGYFPGYEAAEEFFLPY